MKQTVAIQGIKGSFHHQVALEYFQDNVNIDECLSFETLADSLINNKSQQAIMAIENSIAGSIIPNYALIDKNNFHIIGEYYLDIVQNLMVLNGQILEEIQEVHSHPMALLQCMDFLKKHPNIKLVEDKDTAETARRIDQNQIKGIAAIGSKVAAELYNLNIIAPEIQTVNNNMTRFFIISREKNQVNKEEINKASIKFELDDTLGSLATVLNVTTNCKLNLTKIQSMPIIEKPFQYSFIVDVVFEKYKHYEKAVKILELMTNQFKILGEYKSNNKNQIQRQ
ncbi:prephenate dehydratase [Flavobacterium croceum]|uniref:prephenate dehydratase n=1 Tax=Flavobacterium croceum DSM 17960 TaxID=1121886 RepID=A0A2S4NA36_9FLAO|nr:prephenate dehydratase [Flavobacterium croceum]POS02554.1 prephenate dehydratase [Flavobacterium croceum DSM 17960]